MRVRRPTSRRLVAGRLGAALGAAAALVLAAACGTAGATQSPTWVPQKTLPPVDIPTPDGPSGSTSGPVPPSTPGQPAPRSSSPAKQDPAVVATRLNSPTGIAVLPDKTALVAERATGRIVLVQPVAGQPVRPVRTLHGLDPSGGGGLLDLALSASYSEDGLLLALITTRTDTRVVHFTLNGPVTPIVTGIPRGGNDNTGRLLVQGDGSILIGTGDGGRPSRASDPASLGGKVLRVDDIGAPDPDNPDPRSRVLTSGHRTVDGLCDAGGGTLYETEAGRTDELNQLHPGAGYGWPRGGGVAPLTLPSSAGGVGSCAVVGQTLYIAARGGQELLSATLDPRGRLGPLKPLLSRKYGRLLTVVGADDGSLWLTTSNKDGHGSPVPDDERVLHLTPSGGGGRSPV